MEAVPQASDPAPRALATAIRWSQPKASAQGQKGRGPRGRPSIPGPLHGCAAGPPRLRDQLR